MGAGIVFFFWLFIAVIYGVFLALFIGGRRKQSRAMNWLGGVPLMLGTFTGIGVMGAIIYFFIWNNQSTDIYRLSFGSAPTRDVSALQSYNYTFADTGVTFLKFRAAPSTARRLTSKGWTELKSNRWKNQDFSYFLGDSAPIWWKPGKTKTARLFVAHQRFGNFGSEEEILIYDPSNGQTHYAFVGID